MKIRYLLKNIYNIVEKYIILYFSDISMHSVLCHIYDPFHFQNCGHSLTAVNIHKMELAMKPKYQHTTEDIINKQKYKIISISIHKIFNQYR